MTELVDLIDEILETNDSVCTEIIFDLLVVIYRNSLAGNLRVAFLEDKLRHYFTRRIAVRVHPNNLSLDSVCEHNTSISYP